MYVFLNSLLKFIHENEQVLHDEKLDFFRKFLKHYGGTIPEKINVPIISETNSENQKKKRPLIQEIKPKVDGKIDEKYINDPYLHCMGNTIKISKQTQKQALEYKKKGVLLFKEKKYTESAKEFGKSIELCGEIPILFIKRSECLYNMEKFYSCRRDCDRAIELNEKLKVKNENLLVKPYRIRGKAQIALQNIKDGRKDLETAQKIQKSIEIDQELRRLAIFEEPEEKVKEIMQDKEILDKLQKKKIKDAISDIQKDPKNLLKYLNHPDSEIKEFFSKFQEDLMK